jgi:hypothetical protein
MSITKITTAALLAVVGLAATADHASAQITLAPGGVQIGGQTGTGLYVPYSGGIRNAGITTQNGYVYTPSNGAVYAPATTVYSPAYGPRTTYSNGYTNYARPTYSAPVYSNFTNPTYSAPVYGYQSTSGYYSAPRVGSYTTMPGTTIYSTPGGYAYPGQFGSVRVR